MKSTQRKIETDFHRALSTLFDGVSKPFGVTAAFSGGPDSTTLLLLLKHFQQIFSYTLEAAYINHGIRSDKEMDSEEARVVQICCELDIPLNIKKFSPGFLEYYAAVKGCGIEAAARTYRYHYFEKLSRFSEHPMLFALGHNRNDQLETVLMRFFSGSTVEGLKGIPEKRGNYIRPLIHSDRVDIEEYLKQHEIEAVTDSSNLKSDYLRNKLRLDLLGAMENTFPGIQDSVLRLQTDLKDILNHYESLVDESCPWWAASNGKSVSCRESDFIKLPFVSRKSMVLRQMNSLQKGLFTTDRRIPAAFFSPLESLESKTILNGHGIRLIRKGEHLILGLWERNKDDQHTFFILSQDRPFETGSYSIRLCRASALKENDGIIYSVPASIDNPNDESRFLIRTVLSDRELRNFPDDKKNAEMLLFWGNRALCVLNSENIILPEKVKLKKIDDIGSDSNALCVIIRGRGHYAPG